MNLKLEIRNVPFTVNKYGIVNCNLNCVKKIKQDIHVNVK